LHENIAKMNAHDSIYISEKKKKVIFTVDGHFLRRHYGVLRHHGNIVYSTQLEIIHGGTKVTITTRLVYMYIHTLHVKTR
jgi:hypothetical protein